MDSRWKANVIQTPSIILPTAAKSIHFLANAALCSWQSQIAPHPPTIHDAPLSIASSSQRPGTLVDVLEERPKQSLNLHHTLQVSTITHNSYRY